MHRWGKYASYGEWLHSNRNVKVFAHVCDGELRKKGIVGFSLDAGNSSEKNNDDIRFMGSGKENVAAGNRRGKDVDIQGTQIGKRPLKVLENVSFF